MTTQLEEKVKHIVGRIQRSALSNDVKASLYESMQRGIRDVVSAALVSRLPQYQLDALSQHPEKVTPDEIVRVLETTVGDGEVLRSAQAKILEALDSVDAVLTKNKVP